MVFDISDKAKDLQERLQAFMHKYIYPNEPAYFRQLNEGDRWKVIPLIEELKEKAKSEGLWNLFLPESEHGAGLTNYEYAPVPD
jgi:acyl-CoA dehydrogenase